MASLSALWLWSMFLLTPATSVMGDDMGGVFNVPSFSMEELSSGARSEDFLRALRTTGILSVRTQNSDLGPWKLEGPQQSLHRSVAMNGLCHCLEDVASIAGVEGVDSIVLGDQSTRRASVATATVGNSPLNIASRDVLQEQCGHGTVEAMEFLRDQVSIASDTFVRSLDRLHMLYHDNVTPLLRDNQGKSYSTLSSIVQSANHLEHFHYYHTAGDRESNKAKARNNESLSVEWHTDAGLFLAFVPAWDCYSFGEQPDNSFWVQLPNGDKAQARFEPNSVVIMLGAGAEHWIRSSCGLRATRHAVLMDKGDTRTWYGMMKLVPGNAIIEDTPTVKTFDEMKKNMRLVADRQAVYGEVNPLDDQGVAIGCGPSLDDDSPASRSNEIGPLSGSSPMRRRLQHVQDASACNNATNFFCWMQCLEIPSYQQAESYINEGNSLYCLDPGVLARTGNRVGAAIEPCQGKTHNSNCMGVWYPTAPGIPGQKVEYNSTNSNDDGVYCYGGTSMYMDGFHWIHRTTCVIYLFPQWVLSTQGKFAGACLGTLLFGMVLEYIISRRRDSITNMSAGYGRLLASASFYGLQLAMGYLIMLVVMTYSIPLFLCCVFGLVGGHILFNAKDAMVPNRGKPYSLLEKKYADSGTASGSDAPSPGVGNNSDEEATRQTPRDVITTLPECCCAPPPESTQQIQSHYEDDEGRGIPEGSTPCCQNIL